MTTTRKSITKDKPVAPLATTNRMAAFEHLDADDFSIPALHLIQGSGSERMKYGKDHKAGVWVHTLRKADVTGQSIAYIVAVKEQVAWWRMDSTAGSGIHSRYPKGTPVPSDVLINSDIQVIDTLNLYVLLDGDSTPCVIRAKSTALAPVKAVNSLERGRAAAGEPVGLYTLGSDDRSSDNYQWKVPQFTPDGGADQDTMAKVEMFRDMLLTTAVRVTDGNDGSVHVPPGDTTTSVQCCPVATTSDYVDDSTIPF